VKVVSVYRDLGFSIIPLRPASKKPLVRWSEFQERRPSEEELERWFSGKEVGEDVNVGIVCGGVSGPEGYALVVVDCDSEEAVEEVERALERVGIEKRTWVVRTGRGLHLYFLVEAEDEDLVKTRPGLGESGGVDVKGEGSYVVAPPSRHPEGDRYEFKLGPRELVGDGRSTVLEPVRVPAGKWREFLRELGAFEGAGGRGGSSGEAPGLEGFRRLSDREIVRLVELLEDAYRPGYRHHLCLYLSGWAAHARIDPVSIGRVIETLHAQEGDDDPLAERLATVAYSYCKRYPERCEEVREALEEAFGRVYAPRDVEREEVKGRGGLEEVLESVLGEDRARRVILEVSRIFGRPSEGMVIARYGTGFAVADRAKRMVYVARESGDGLEFRYPVARFVPVEVRVYDLEGVEEQRWEVVIEDRAGDRFQVEGTFEEVLERLKPYATHPHFQHVFSAVLQKMKEKGLVERRSVYRRPGFYLTDDGLECVGEWLEGEPSREELRAALELLDELATRWFDPGKFARVIRWAVVAPLSFAVKQAGKGWLPWLFLQGQAKCGKTTLGEIVLNLWGVPDNLHYVDTKAQLCAVLEGGTLPILINEPRGLFEYDSNVEVVKRAIESPVSREVYRGRTLKRELALAPVVFTSNRDLPEDTGLRRRFVVVRFSMSDRVTPDLERRFNREVRPRLEELSALGRWLARRFVEEGEELLSRVAGDWESVARELLEEAYRAAGLEPPGWLHAEPEDEEDPEREALASLEERVRAFLRDEIDRRANPHDHCSLRERAERVLKEGRLPYADCRRYKGRWHVLFTTELVRALEDAGVEVAGGLKALAELLGWEYAAARVNGRVRRVARVPLKEFLDFLDPEPEALEPLETERPEEPALANGGASDGARARKDGPLPLEEALKEACEAVERVLREEGEVDAPELAQRVAEELGVTTLEAMEILPPALRELERAGRVEREGDEVRWVPGRGEVRERVLEAVRELEPEHSEGVPKRVLVDRLSSVPRELVEDALRELVERGELPEPQPGRYKTPDAPDDADGAAPVEGDTRDRSVEEPDDSGSGECGGGDESESGEGVGRAGEEDPRDRVMSLLRELALEHPNGVPEVVLLDRAREVGLDEDEARETLRGLVAKGEAVSPTPGAYLPRLSGEEERVFRRFYREYLRAWAGESEFEWEDFLDEPEEILRQITPEAGEEVIQRVLDEVQRLGTLSVPSELLNLAHWRDGASEEELVQAVLPRLPAPDPELARETLKALQRGGHLQKDGDEYTLPEE